jgi:multidrug efflux pump subunit AcrA (membrane-fusion protein)
LFAIDKSKAWNHQEQVMKKTIFTLAALTILAAAFIFFHRDAEGIAVKVLAAEKGEILSTLSATGKVVSREEAAISAAVSALVQAVMVEEGERVEAGAILALLDNLKVG